MQTPSPTASAAETPDHADDDRSPTPAAEPMTTHQPDHADDQVTPMTTAHPPPARRRRQKTRRATDTDLPAALLTESPRRALDDAARRYCLL